MCFCEKQLMLYLHFEIAQNNLLKRVIQGVIFSHYKV
jgi:hypothetical protein